jgi:phosphatidylinositol alpha-1,6-mannosyltransferase
VLGIPVILYVHGEEITTRFSAGSFGRRRSYLQAADGIVSVSRFTQKALVEQMGVRPSGSA